MTFSASFMVNRNSKLRYCLKTNILSPETPRVYEGIASNRRRRANTIHSVNFAVCQTKNHATRTGMIIIDFYNYLARKYHYFCHEVRFAKNKRRTAKCLQ